MVINEGGWDRAARIGVGAAIMAMAIVGPWWPWGLLGAVPLLAGATGWCPLYALLGISTCSTRRP